MIVISEAILKENKIVIEDSISYDVVLGKHCIWIPALNIKLIWSWRGRIESRYDWERGRNADKLLSGRFGSDYRGFELLSLDSILNEVTIMKILAKENMAPPIGEIIYIENFISDYPYGVEQCDCTGIYGYEILDATELAPGSFSEDKFKKEFVNTKKIMLSAGAYNDIFVEERNNIVNGYLIDVRRTIWDMMRAAKTEEKITPHLDRDKLKEQIKQLTQFPHKQRKENYQSYFDGEEYVPGSRNTEYRFEQMKITSKDIAGKSVLDLGCNLGSFCLESYRLGAFHVMGIDSEKDYVNCARALARSVGYHINYMKMDLSRTKDIIDYTKKYFKYGVDVLFALSIYKHIEESLWELLRGINWKVCYLESHNAPEGEKTGHVQKMKQGIASLNCQRVAELGMTSDRSPRYVWRLEK